MTDAARLAALAGRYLDLISAPFTLPRSRVLVFRAEDGGGVRVHTSEYERRLSECRVLDALTVRDADGEELAVVGVDPVSVTFGRHDSDTTASLTFADPTTLSLGGDQGMRVRLRHPDGAVEEHPIDQGLRLHVGRDRSVSIGSGDHATALAVTGAVWEEWFAKCPPVREDLQPMTAFCWWVLGANIVELPALGDARAIVPSKIGYVGLWQWDAYFIAVGVRHGDPALAREQLDIAFRFPQPDGQLPDVVHELGVLATSDDLPESDRATLRRAGSQVADPSAPVPLTKPPLAAWALRKVLEVEEAPDFARTQLARIIRSQDWWFDRSDLDHDGMPEYGHPYSSGLDDSPIFDGPLPTAAPDLGAYLVRQDLEIADLLVRYAPTIDDAPFRARAAATQRMMLTMWDADRGRFLAFGGGEPQLSDTIVGLVPLLTGTLPAPIAEVLVDATADPDRFALAWGLPTVAASDPDFSDERMWRGPVWVNTNALIAEGLESSGYVERARQLREQTVALVIHGGGPHEYFNPHTGQKARTATTAFGWSAALFVDLAVQLSR